VSWESKASNWIAWAREPGHDAYWYYRDAFFERIREPAATMEDPRHDRMPLFLHLRALKQ
jgi:hypothetical protein